MNRRIEIPETITVGNLADSLMLPSTRIISELFKNGIMATINEKIDFDTATIIVGDLGLDIELVKQENNNLEQKFKKKVIINNDAKPRPPVVAIMGHVDHGKTSLMDAIRGGDKVKHEAGGITQHLSAYEVKWQDREITFLDTPGHEAFASLREHGAHLTDIVLILVAADDGIKPQTLEAIRFAKKAGVKIMSVISKIDKEGADVNRVKQQLAENDLMPEEWGGDTVTLEVSAKTNQGIDQLLDMILLVTDVEDYSSDYDVPAEGLIIESHMEKGKGPIAVALIQRGTMKQNDFVVSGQTYAKIRQMKNSRGETIKVAGPSSAVTIYGFKALPQFSDEFLVVDNEKTARKISIQNLNQKVIGNSDMTSHELIRLINHKTNVSELNIIIKADVQGSVTSVIDSLKSLNTEEVAVRIISSGVGVITENDLRLAKASNAIIYAFSVDLPTGMQRIASRDKIKVRLFKIIYELIDDVKSELSELLAPEVVETELGRLLVRGIFKTTVSQIICGGEVTKGRIISPSIAKIYRGNELIDEAEVSKIKRGPVEAKEVSEGEMCGLELNIKHKLQIQEGDRIEIITREIKQRTL